MARKVFISVLGAGMYESCKYSAGSFCSKETRFVQQAMLEYLNAQEWPDDSRAFFLLTDKARAANWIVDGERRFNNQKGSYVSYIGLKKVLESSEFPFPFEGVHIPDGKDENEMWTIFETAFKLLNDGDELYFDLTHSFRYLPMLILVLGNYAKFLKNAKVCSITYGNYEARDVTANEAPIVDLIQLSALQDWTFATADFLKNGYADRLVELADRGLNPLMRNEATRTEDTKRLKSFVNNLKIFSLDMQTCRGQNIIDASPIKKIKLDIESLNKVVIPQLEPVLQQVSDSVDAFDDAGSVMNAFKAAQWCYDNQQYQQAITYLEEGIISYFCINHGIAIEDRNKRELVTSAFNVVAQDIPKENWRVGNSEWIELLGDLANDTLLRSIAKDFVAVAALRNDYNHCGMRTGALKSDKIREKIKKSLDKITTLLGNSKRLDKTDFQSEYLINFSNHPSELWEANQLEASKEYGKIMDIPFPNVNPDASAEEIQDLAERYAEKILSLAEGNRVTVHVMGEMTLTYLVVTLLKEKGIECIASTSERYSEEIAIGRKITEFKFVRFRKY